MSIPKSQKQWLVQGTDKGIDGLVKQDNVPIPEVGENEVLVRLHGASLNYRDLIIPRACLPIQSALSIWLTLPRECIPSP